MSTLAVVDREGTPRAAIEAALDRLSGGECVRFFTMPQIAISSTLVRRRLQARQPVRYLVPAEVIDYIERHQLYGTAPSATRMTASA
jgi:nicotinate-nucleotide adenylyltransferase